MPSTIFLGQENKEHSPLWDNIPYKINTRISNKIMHGHHTYLDVLGGLL
jgi:hypothetical protein